MYHHLITNLSPRDRMANFDEDDLIDYDASEGEEFDEDRLNDEEYDRLYGILPKLKQEAAKYNDDIEEIELKEALYFNYYEVDDALNELKSKFPRKKNTALADLAAARKGKGVGSFGSSPNRLSESSSTEKSGGSFPTKTTGSKLSALAKMRSGKGGLGSLVNMEKDTSLSGNKNVDILSRLNSSGSQNLSLSPKLSISRGGRAGGFSSRLTASKLQNTYFGGREAGNSLKGPKDDRKDDKKEDKPKDLNPPETANPAKLNCDISIDTSILLDFPRTDLSVLFFRKRRHSDIDDEISVNLKHRKTHLHEIMKLFTNHEFNTADLKNAQTNFKTPSPDDEILSAQQKSFEKDISNLKIADKKSEVESKPTKPIAKSSKPFKKIDVAKELSSNSDYTKPRKSFVVIGHVDAGKSTLMGRMLFDVGAVSAKTLNSLVRQSEKIGKGSFALAWIMDQTTQERSRGVTIDICATSFETSKTKFTAIDAPGHKDFVPQMINGVSQADLAVLVVDSINGEFESGFSMDGQTKEHTILAKCLGIERLCVVVNKMDKENWSQERFIEIKSQMIEFLTGPEISFAEEQIDFIPLSALTGDNVIKTQQVKELYSWYKGPSLLDYLEQIDTPNSSTLSNISTLLNENFALAVNDVFEISSSEFEISGKVSSGIIQPGETVHVTPSNDYLQVQSVSCHDKQVDIGVKGEIILLTMKINQLSNKVVEDLNIGDLVLNTNSSIKAVNSFTANISLFNMKKPLLIGTPFILFRNNCRVSARISKIIEIKDTTKKKKKMHLVSNQSALVEIEIQSDRALPVSKFSENKTLGRVVLRREGITIGAGTVSDF